MAETAEQVEQRLLHGPGGVDEWVNKHYQQGIDLSNAQDQIRSQQKTIDGLNATVRDLQVKLQSATSAAPKTTEPPQNTAPSGPVSLLDSYSFGELLSAAFKKLFKLK